MSSQLDRLRGLEDTTEEQTGESAGCFGWLRGMRDRALMLELRKGNGNILALSYADLEAAAFDPSDGITLEFHRITVRVRGQNLNAGQPKLFEGIVRHRVSWLHEIDHAQRPEAARTGTAVSSIDWSE